MEDIPTVIDDVSNPNLAVIPYQQSPFKKFEESINSKDSINSPPKNKETNELALNIALKWKGFISPIAVSHCSVTGKTFIAEQTGIVWEIDGNKARPFLDISKSMVKLGTKHEERGLLGLALHPEFGTHDSKNSQKFYIFYSANKDAYQNKFPARYKYPGYYDSAKSEGEVYYNCVSEFSHIKRNGAAEIKSEKMILVIQKNLAVHNGGRLCFGPDGYLYISVGDGGPQMDTYEKAQDPFTFHGKILRIDVNSRQGGKRYSIPYDNPYYGKKSSGLEEIFAIGLRNPWSMCFDAKKRLLVADVGLSTMESLKIVSLGANCGWNFKEGSVDTNWKKNRKLRGKITEPVWEYTTPKPVGAIIGGYSYVAKNNRIRYICGDLSGILFLLEEDEEGIWKELIRANPFRGEEAFIKAFGLIDGQICALVCSNYEPTGNTGRIIVIFESY